MDNDIQDMTIIPTKTVERCLAAWLVFMPLLVLQSWWAAL